MGDPTPSQLSKKLKPLLDGVNQLPNLVILSRGDSLASWRTVVEISQQIQAALEEKADQVQNVLEVAQRAIDRLEGGSSRIQLPVEPHILVSPQPPAPSSEPELRAEAPTSSQRFWRYVRRFFNRLDAEPTPRRDL